MSKNVYIHKLADIADEYDNTYHSTIKIKPIDVKSSTYIDFGIEKKEKDLKSEVGDHVRISKYKNIFAKGYTPSFLIKKAKNTVLWTYVTEDVHREEIIATFYEKELQKTNQTEFTVKKVI